MISNAEIFEQLPDSWVSPRGSSTTSIRRQMQAGDDGIRAREILMFATLGSRVCCLLSAVCCLLSAALHRERSSM